MSCAPHPPTLFWFDFVPIRLCSSSTLSSSLRPFPFVENEDKGGRQRETDEEAARPGHGNFAQPYLCIKTRTSPPVATVPCAFTLGLTQFGKGGTQSP